MSGTLEQTKPQVEMQPAFSEVMTYRTISRSAVIALILSIVSLLAFFVSWLLVLPVVSVVLGLTALSTIRLIRRNTPAQGRPWLPWRSPRELSCSLPPGTRLTMPPKSPTVIPVSVSPSCSRI